jgi:hypothetical protein
MVHSKECFKCLAVKPLTEFYKHKQMADGHVNKCKECNKTDVAEHRSKNIEKIREYDRGRSRLLHRLELKKEINKRWLSEHKDRSNAQQKLRRAVKNGTVKKQLCWACGEKAEAHHPDYSRPLDVVWLCVVHHRQTHALIKV